jgi:hypothetical protein
MASGSSPFLKQRHSPGLLQEAASPPPRSPGGKAACSAQSLAAAIVLVGFTAVGLLAMRWDVTSPAKSRLLRFTASDLPEVRQGAYLCFATTDAQLSCT